MATSDGPVRPDLSGLSLVVVEDNEDNLEVLETFLRYCGARVEGKRTAAAALDFLSAEGADAILTDVTLLPAGAVEFIDRIHAIHQHSATPIIAVTGRTEKEVRPVESGFAAFMQKPIDLDRLCVMILRLVQPAT